MHKQKTLSILLAGTLTFSPISTVLVNAEEDTYTDVEENVETDEELEDGDKEVKEKEVTIENGLKTTIDYADNSVTLDRKFMTTANGSVQDPSPVSAKVKDATQIGYVQNAGYDNEEDFANDIIKVAKEITTPNTSVQEDPNVIFLLDDSGSMSGTMATALVTGVTQTIKNLYADNPNTAVGFAYMNVSPNYTFYHSEAEAIAALNRDYSATGGTYIEKVLGYGKTFLTTAPTTTGLNEGGSTYVIFITDVTGTATSAEQTVVKGLKAATTYTPLVDFYSIGVSGATSSAYQGLTDSNKEFAVTTGAQLATSLETIKSMFEVGYVKDIKVSDTLTEDYKIIVDALHPILFNNKTYTDIMNLPSNLTVQDNIITFTVNEAGENAYNLSYYVQGKEEAISTGTEVEDLYETAYFKYKAPIVKDGKISHSAEQTKNASNYAVNYQKSNITATMASDAPSGAIAEEGAEIKYTMTLHNEGDIDADLFSSIYLSDGLDYVAGGTYLEDESRVLFEKGSGIDPSTLIEDEETDDKVDSEEVEVLALDDSTNAEDSDADVDSDEAEEEYIPEIDTIPANSDMAYTVLTRVNGESDQMYVAGGFGTLSNVQLDVDDYTLELYYEEIEYAPELPIVEAPAEPTVVEDDEEMVVEPVEEEVIEEVVHKMSGGKQTSVTAGMNIVNVFGASVAGLGALLFKRKKK